MQRSLESYGQLSPIVVVRHDNRWELIDGFKRLGAARKLGSMERLLARQLATDERGAKAAIFGLNRAGGRTREIEEAWIVHALVRDDGLTQVEVVELLGRRSENGMSYSCSANSRARRIISPCGSFSKTNVAIRP
jgi:ParB-like chromosome segregation protein Spo0J